MQGSHLVADCLLFSLLLAAAAAGVAQDAAQWKLFKQRYQRAFADAREEERRFGVFRDNLRRAEELQSRAGRSSALFGVTPFSDLTPAEFRATHASLNISSIRAALAARPTLNAGKGPISGSASNQSIDWRAAGYVTSVKNQEACGAGWAFAAAAAAEACRAQTYGTPVDISAAQILDCCEEPGCSGCFGGEGGDALWWSMSHDLATLSCYPYFGHEGRCLKPQDVALYHDTCTFYRVERGEESMLFALNKSVVVTEVDSYPLQFYVGGVISGELCDFHDPDQAVVLVSDMGGGDSYVLKNSWGDMWGEDGYFRLAKKQHCLNVDQDCSVAF